MAGDVAPCRWLVINTCVLPSGTCCACVLPPATCCEHGHCRQHCCSHPTLPDHASLVTAAWQRSQRGTQPSGTLCTRPSGTLCQSSTATCADRRPHPRSQHQARPVSKPPTAPSTLTSLPLSTCTHLQQYTSTAPQHLHHSAGHSTFQPAPHLSSSLPSLLPWRSALLYAPSACCRCSKTWAWPLPWRRARRASSALASA
jgi:hypothetical protein